MLPAPSKQFSRVTNSPAPRFFSTLNDQGSGVGEVVQADDPGHLRVMKQLESLLEQDSLDSAQCNSLLRNLQQVSMYDKMFKVFVMMENQGPAPNSQTFSIMKEAAETLGRQDWAAQFNSKI